MAEIPGADHDDTCATARSTICVCACRGRLHGARHRGGVSPLLERMARVTVRGTGGGGEPETAAGRQANPVTVTQVDPPPGVRVGDGPTVTATIGPTSKVPADLAGVDDDELLALLVDPDVAQDDSQANRVWAELDRREQEQAAEAARLPALPADLGGMAEDDLLGALSTYGADEQAMRRVWDELTRREQVEAARVEADAAAERVRIEREREAAEAEVRRKAAADAEAVAYLRALSDGELQSRLATAMFGRGGDPVVRDRLVAERKRRDDAQKAAAQAADDARTHHRYAIAPVRDLTPDELRAADVWLTGMTGRRGDQQRVRVGGITTTADDLAEIASGRLAEIRARLVDVDQAEADREARKAAGPAEPAKVTNPLQSWAHVEMTVNGYRNTPESREAAERAQEAKRRVLGLPDSATGKDIKAAERADPRSPGQRAAGYIAWYRHLAQFADLPDAARDWQKGPADSAWFAPTRPAVPPVNTPKAWDLWQEIRQTAKADQQAKQPGTWHRYLRALKHAYDLPDDAGEAVIMDAFRADDRTEQQKAAAYLGHFRELARGEGIDPTDRARYGPPEKPAKRAPTQWAEPTPEQDRQMDALLARGYEYLDAYAEVHNLDPSVLRGQQAATVVDRASGERVDQAVRRQYDEWVHLSYVQAETAVRGHVLNTAGKKAGIDPVTLFSGTDARARKYASEDLMRWWADNGGRRTYTQFKAQVLGRAGDKRAAKVSAMAGQGKDFG